MPIRSAPRASIVAADAQLRGASRVSRRVYCRSRCTMRRAAIPLPPSDFTTSVSWRWGPRSCSSSCRAITSLSQTEPLVEVQYVTRAPSTLGWIFLRSACVFAMRSGGVLTRWRRRALAMARSYPTARELRS